MNIFARSESEVTFKVRTQKLRCLEFEVAFCYLLAPEVIYGTID